MSTYPQLAELYLRGNLVNVTIKNLTEDEREHVSLIAEYVANLSGVQKARQIVAKKLGDTIRGEYKNRDAADQESQITIWRAVANLYYHRSYDFECKQCGTSTYTTKVGKKRIVDQLFPSCKECGCLVVTHVGDSTLTEESDPNHKWPFVHRDIFQESYAHLEDDDDLPESETPFAYIPGKKVCEDPDSIVNSEEDVTKLFTEFIWSGFKQILNENKRKQHNKKPKHVFDRADIIVLQEILAMFAKFKVSHNYCPMTQPENGWFNITVSLLQASPEVSIEIAALLHKAHSYDVPFKLTNNTVSIKETLAAPSIGALISQPEYVLVTDNYSSTTGDDDEGMYTLNSISFRTIEGTNMDLENHIRVTESNDWLSTVRDALPIGISQQVFDIWSQTGETYDRFIEWCEENRIDYDNKFEVVKCSQANINHMATFLGVGRKAIHEARQNIQINSYRYMSADARQNICLDDVPISVEN